jgi:DNA repair protein RadC
VDLALQVLEARNRKGQVLGSPTETQAYLRLRLAERPNEVFACLYLDNRHRVLALEELFQGTIDGASVHPREVVRRALEYRAGAVIVAHCHPSGVAEPSQADLRVTERLKSALSLVDVRVLDHVIVATEGAVSFAERGLL